MTSKRFIAAFMAVHKQAKLLAEIWEIKFMRRRIISISRDGSTIKDYFKLGKLGCFKSEIQR